MSIIIPSKQIYSIDNKKVKNNVILGTTGSIPDIYMPPKKLSEFNWQPFEVYRPNPMQLVFKLVPSEFPETNEITLSQEKEGSTVYVVIKIKLSDANFIDIRNLNLAFSYQYIYGRSLGEAESDYRYVKDYGEPEIKKINISPRTQSFYPIISAKNNIPLLYIYSEILSPDDYDAPTKEATVQFKIPVEYWSPTQTENDEDVAFLLDINFFVSAPSYNYDNTKSFSFGETKKQFEIPTNELSIAKYNGKEIFKYISEKTISSYKLGKETATIRAGIGEYYLEDGTLAISTKRDVNPLINWYTENNSELEFKEKSYGQYEYKVPANLPISWYNNIGKATLVSGEYEIKCIYPKESYGRIRLNQYNETGDDKDRFVDINFVDNVENQEKTFTLNTETDVYLHYCSDAENPSIGKPQFTFELIIKRLSDGNLTKMTFEIGDKVTPMVRRADGTDTPMSRTTSGTAKQFRVCGIKTYYDGAVWQELTLQEV